MTPDRARTTARRWFTLAITVLVIRLTLDSVGIDLLSLPLQGVTALCLMASMHRVGWATGYRARDEASR